MAGSALVRRCAAVCLAWVWVMSLAASPPAHAAGAVTLRYRLRPGDHFAFARTATVIGTFRLRHGGNPAASGETSLQVSARVWAMSTQEVAGHLPDGAYRVIERHALRVEVGGVPLPVPAFGPTETRLTPLGVRQGIGGGALSDLLPFGPGIPDMLPGAVLQFPPGPVRVGARWETRSEWILPGHQDAWTTAESRLVAIEDVAGRQCARIGTDAAIPGFSLAAGPREGGGMLRVRGLAAGETLHALDTGMPLLSRMRIRLRIEAEGVAAAGEAPPTGEGELTVDVECRQVPSAEIPAPGVSRGAPPQAGVPKRQPIRPAPRGGNRGQGGTAAPVLRILRPALRASASGELLVECRVSHPEARYALLKVDGVARAAINAPYQYRLGLEGLSPGEHVLEVTVYGPDGIALETARRPFRIASTP